MRTTKACYLSGIAILQGIVNTPALDSLLLLCHALSISKEDYWQDPDQKLERDKLQTFQTLLARRAAREPLAYLVQEKEFYGKHFFVDERVLIPRPDTEILVESALDLLQVHPSLTHVFDVGTGSGVIGLCVAVHAPTRRVHLIDLSLETLSVARVNRQRLHLSEVILEEGSLLSGWKTLPEGSLILANLPYLTEEEVAVKDALYPNEPHLALLGGGEEGLDLIHNLLDQIILKRQGLTWIILEASNWQIPLLSHTMRDKGFHGITTKTDLAGKERIVLGRL